MITIATLTGHPIPLLPFAWLSRTTAPITAIGPSALVLFGVGVCSSRTLAGDWRQNGLKTLLLNAIILTVADDADPGRSAGSAAAVRQSPRQDHVTMAAEPPEGLIIEAVHSLEVRWIFPGQLAAGVARWFGRFPTGTESREDTYLLGPPLPGLSVKVRGGGALEVKVCRGSPGILEVTGRACGYLESWQKWSFPFSPRSQGSGGPGGWVPVRKRRRISRFPLAGGQIAARASGLGQEPGCEVELTEIRTHGQHWWTLGFEATGPAELLRSGLEATAALVFSQPLPGGVEPGPDQSRSYAEWLGQRPGSEMTSAPEG